ncbi:diadenosine tetraphosphate (Ap4A) HIT family hydrolase [Yoonia sediminilitoris]|uniref:Diadenosine tetraphosphate (Ap4A) HIT family hydrolase n=2 Tax=Yoonia sediminilitoris TaxID=1286148 RepID=A0A2T6KRT2_9RHOB|nr:diadenosine tetraphosphate (Ap4A) HIT family hydrolase [Yoonia sediminilitoris]RCW99437.1 diadenosine tetraphosphate (Ap4A) HIT family hydrolase [Yoonia sediminilitoris]
MSHIYQPVMLKVLLENGGHATVEQIAKALLSYDQSQVEYYSIRTKTMVGQVLTKNGVVTPTKDGTKITGYRLNQEGLTEAERASLSTICDSRLDDFTNSRGDAIWSHRGAGREYLPGSIRYQVLKRAKYRCELCGGLEGQAALQVDHILPKARGGADDLFNFQALCSTCNANKRDTDDTDFRGVAETYSDREVDCIFCELGAGRIIAENELCIAIEDGFPVTQHHTLIIPKRHVADYFDLYQPERNAIETMLHVQRQRILDQDPKVTGFNVGINAGVSAGQTVFHVHVHLIPRRDGDAADPKGGVRGVIPGKQKY